MPPDIEAIAEQVFTALADPTRRAILATLAAEGPATATDLAGRLPITRQAIAKHLALLAEAGLVRAEPGERRRVRYRLQSAPMQVAQQFLAGLARDWDGPLHALKDHLGQLLAGRPEEIAGRAPARPRWFPGSRHQQRKYKEQGRRQAMTNHKTGTREEWLAARLELLEAEKEQTRHGDELARQRQELPWVRVDKDYRFETDDGTVSLTDLFRGRSQLLVYHFMFGPGYTAGCPTCSTIADGFNGFASHLANHDVMLWAVSRAPLAKLQGYQQRMGWNFPWASSFGSDFNYDFDVSVTDEQQRAGAFEYNFRESPVWSPPEDMRGPFDAWAATTGTDWATYTRERPGMSAFALEDGVVYHTYSAYARGLDGLWGMYQWLDRAPRGRNETRAPDDPLNWFRRHDEYQHANGTNT